MYLVCTIKYSKEETNEKNQLVLVRKEHNLLVECCNYTEAEAEAMQAIMQEKLPDAEINLINGGQPVYYFIISAE